ncbi:UNVERIFIED_CONTAM: hypothetical protein Q9R58_25735 [Methylobacteriaceae bacterium AG10]|nr:hypothetical protein [Methylobacteriaceae bacterium AG10]
MHPASRFFFFAVAALSLTLATAGMTLRAAENAFALEREWQRQNAICLDNQFENEGLQTPRMRVGCARRAVLMKRLRALNRCYGRLVLEGPYTAYVWEWHDCRPDSATYNDDRQPAREFGSGWELRR